MFGNSSFSFQDSGRKTFHILDYVVFSTILILSAAIGFFLAYKDKHKKSTRDFLLAGRTMHVLPVTLSMLATFVSAITILGNPAEMYVFGTMFIWFGLSYLTALIFAAHLYIPVFYNLGVTSVFEYLDQRFNKLVSTFCSMAYCVQMLLLMSIVLYAPSLALNAVTGLNLWATVCAVGLVCSLYTMVGGMKAVLWTDTFQTGVMLLGLIVILVKGSHEVGGFTEAWNKAAERGRIQFLDFSLDPTIRHSFWSLVIGGTASSLSLYGTNQALVQRAITLPTIQKMKLAVWINVPLKMILATLCALVGIVMFAFYRDCDPLEADLVQAKDQIMPLFVMDVLGSLPGIPGLFVAVLFSGALSTLSSGLNSMATAVMQDIVRPLIRPNISERHALLLAKILSGVLGLFTLALSYMASLLGGLLQATITLDGVIGGSLLGVFTLGMIFPWANSYGACVGLASSISFLLWISIGARVVRPPIHRPALPVIVSGCMLGGQMGNTTNSTFIMTTTTTSTITELANMTRTGMEAFYSISYLYYSGLAVLIVCTVGITVSFITGYTRPSTVNPKLVSPVFDIFFPFLPEKVLKPLRFGVDYSSMVENKDFSKVPQTDQLKDEEAGVGLEAKDV